jgi:phosphinothricin acetyltransferase
VIRPAEPRDAGPIAAVWNPVIRGSAAIFSSEERGEDDIATLVARDFWVWQEAGALVGFCRIFPFRAGDGYVRTVEHTVMVAEGARGRGIGRGLVEHAAAVAAAQGKHSLWAAVAAANGAGLAFHRALGFVEHGRLPEVGWKFGRFHDVVLMGRRLGCSP